MSQFIRDDQVDSSMSIWSLFMRMWPYIRRHRIYFFMLLLSVFALAATARLLPQLIGLAVDESIGQRRREIFLNIAGAYLGLQILKIGLDLFYSYGFQKLGNRVLFYIRADLIGHTLKMPMNYFNTTPVGRTLTRVTTDVNGLGDLFTDALVNMLIHFVEIISIVIALFILSPKLALVTLLTTPLFIWTSYFLSEKIRIILRDLKKVQSAMNAFLAENLNGIKVIHLYNHQKKTSRKFMGFSADFFHHTVRSTRGYALMQPTNNLFNAFTFATALGYGGYLTMNGEIPIGYLVAFVLHIQDYMPPLRDIIEKYQSFQNSVTSGERVFHMLDEEIEANSGTIQNVSFLGHLKVNNVSFRYPRTTENALSNISFELQAGESLAIVGRTGSGKTTLVSLFQRFYDSTEGEITIDNIPCRDFEINFLRKNIGLVQQESFIFRGSIADNVRLFDETITDQQVINAISECGYLDLLKRTNRPIDFMLEEKGANISAGERQLIAFARILAFSPQILILDEATSNIDSESEEIIKVATKKLAEGRTTIVIAHRLSTIQNCDKILQLDHGRVLRFGLLKEIFPTGIGKELYEDIHSPTETKDADSSPSVS